MNYEKQLEEVGYLTERRCVDYTLELKRELKPTIKEYDTKGTAFAQIPL